MKIKIETRCKPFSHTLGATCLIPGTHFKIQAFPTLLKIDEWNLPISVNGPVENFTVEQDLEKGIVSVFGKSSEGFYRFKIKAQPDGFEILGKEKIFLKKEISYFWPEQIERLSLGNQKAMNWDLVWKRNDLAEILPVLYLLAQKTPFVSPHFPNCDLTSFCRALFSHILVPRLKDEEYQGLKVEVDPTISPMALIQGARAKIRSLFFNQSGNHISLLSENSFPAGKFLNVQAQEWGELDIEWTKNRLRQLLFRAKKSGDLFLDLPKEIKKYRLRTNLKQKGTWHKANQLLEIEADKIYYLDRFQI